MKTKQLLLIVLMISPIISLADKKPIESAFGFKLGSKLDIAKYKIIEKQKDGGIKLQFTPAYPYQPLTQYHVYITPKSNRIYKITGYGNFTPNHDCVNELSTIEKVLTKKYGEFKREKYTIGTATKYTPQTQHTLSYRYLSNNISCSCNTKGMYISYTDMKTEKLLESENPNTSATGRNTSGL